MAAVSLSCLPGWADGQWNYNGGTHITSNLCTAGGVQYVVWWDGQRRPMLSRRALPDGSWSAAVNLGAIPGNPLAAPVPADGHNTLSVGVDAAGHVHVAGNLHANPLRYVRTATPGDLSAWVAPGMVGVDESLVTYPAFVTLPDGTLLFFYRQGGSGAGDWYANRLDVGATTWARVGKVIDGLASGESAYPNRWAVDAAGDVHVFGCWRGTGSADTNRDFFYARLTGLSAGQTPGAHRADECPQALPVTHATCEVVIPTGLTGSGMVNTHGADVDTEGHPHAATWLYDAAGNTQVQHVWHDGTTWHVDQVTDHTRRIDLAVSTIDLPLSRAQVVCGPTGNTLIVYRCNYDGRRGTVRAIDVTPGAVRAEFPIARLDLHEWEPSFDAGAQRDRGELHMLLVPLTGNGPARSGVGADCWTTQFAAVLTVDLTAAEALRAEAVRLPSLRVVAGQAGPPVGFTVTATTPTDLGHGAVMVPEDAGRVFFARALTRPRGLAADVTTTVQIRSQREFPAWTQRFFGSATVIGTTAGYRATPWVPVVGFGLTPDDRGWVQLFAHRSGSTSGQVTIATLEVAVLD